MSARASTALALVAALAPTLCSGVAAARDSGGARLLLLPVDGPTDAVRDRAIRRALRQRRAQLAVVDAAVAARASAAATHLAAARRALRQADDRELQMDRAGAVAAARRAIVLALRGGARLVDRALLVRAHLAHGLTLLLRPADETAARAAFARALALDPALRRDRRRFSTRATALFEAARRGARPVPPATDELGALAGLADARYVLWLGATPGRGSAAESRLTAVLFDARRKKVRLRVERSAAGSEAVSAAAALARTALSGVDAEPGSGSAGSASAPGTRPAKPLSSARPWYRRWWVWTLVGAAIVGAGVGVGVALGSGSDDPPGAYELRFRFQ